MNRLVIQFDYTDEAQVKLFSLMATASSLEGVKSHTDSFTAPKGSVHITEVYPNVDIQKAFERPINYEMGEAKK